MRIMRSTGVSDKGAHFAGEGRMHRQPRAGGDVAGTIAPDAFRPIAS